ncbi:MAG: dTMP kinase [Azospirillaceae bacterium]|nr:dTMP kinase [Azospirillaceae bacterium]
MAKGRFITIEGGEGAGKTTHVRRLAATLRDRGCTVLDTREPGGSPGAEQIRALLVSGDVGRWDVVTETLLHLAARRDHLVRAIWPALAAGTWVVCDRYADSTMAYQGYGQGLAPEIVDRFHALATDGFKPDLTLILDLPADRGLSRAWSRNPDRASDNNRYERMDRTFHERLRQGFLTIARSEPGRCVVIDASQDLDAVSAAIEQAVFDRFQTPALEPPPLRPR